MAYDPFGTSSYARGREFSPRPFPSESETNSQVLVLPRAEDVGKPGSMSAQEYFDRLKACFDRFPSNSISLKGDKLGYFKTKQVVLNKTDNPPQEIIITFFDVPRSRADEFMRTCETSSINHRESVSLLEETTAVWGNTVSFTITHNGFQLKLTADRIDGWYSTYMSVPPQIIDHILENISDPRNPMKRVILIEESKQMISTPPAAPSKDASKSVHQHTVSRAFSESSRTPIQAPITPEKPMREPWAGHSWQLAMINGEFYWGEVRDMPLTSPKSNENNDGNARKIPYGERHPENKKSGAGRIHRLHRQKANKGRK